MTVELIEVRFFEYLDIDNEKVGVKILSIHDFVVGEDNFKELKEFVERCVKERKLKG